MEIPQSASWIVEKVLEIRERGVEERRTGGIDSKLFKNSLDERHSIAC